MSERKAHRSTAVITGLVLLALLVLLVPFPVKREVPALEIKLDDPTYLVECRIEISGYYHINIFEPNAFHGQITVSDYTLTSKDMLSPIYLDKDGYPLEYGFWEEATPRPIRYTYLLGRIYAKAFMKEPIITVFIQGPLDKESGAVIGYGGSGSWSTEDGYCIVAGAKDRDEAIRMLIKNGLIYP